MSRSGIGGLVVVLLSGVLVLAPARVSAQKKPPVEKGGVVWEVKVLDNDEVVQKGRFRAVDNKIYHEGRQIGTYVDLAKDHSKVSINHGKLNGKFDLKMITAEPPTWEGELTRKEGGKYKVVVEFIRPGKK